MLARRRGRRVAPTLLLASALLAACKGQAHRAAPPPTIVDAAPAIDARPAPGGWFPDDASIKAHVDELASPALRGRGDGTADEAAAAVALGVVKSMYTGAAASAASINEVVTTPSAMARSRLGQ